MIHHYYNSFLLRNHQIVKEDLWVKDGVVIAPQSSADFATDMQGKLISPGWIDLQINGAFGKDFSSDLDAQEIISKKLPEFGVTAYLATIVSSTQEDYLRVIPRLQPQKGELGATLLGIHLEGPFLSHSYSGAHDFRVLRIPKNFSDPESFYGSLNGVKLVTLAPELLGALSWITLLNSKGIVVSAGHTDATFLQMHEAIENGLSAVTHLFNRMRPFDHREPGVIGAALSNDRLFYSLIADGIHVHPVAIDLAWKSHKKGAFLISDGMAGVGLPDGFYMLGRQEVEVINGRAILADKKDTLAGSILTMDVAVRNLIKFTGCPLAEALEAASLRPAEVLGISDRKGSLEVGADADFIVLDANLKVLTTYVAGHVVWNNR